MPELTTDEIVAFVAQHAENCEKLGRERQAAAFRAAVRILEQHPALIKALRTIANDSGFGAHNRMRKIARAALNTPPPSGEGSDSGEAR